MSAWIGRSKRGRFRRFAPVAAVVAAIAWSAAASADPLTVILDQAQIVKLPERVSTIVVGNPTVADVSVQPGGILVVTGRGYGATNILALDRSGRLLMDKAVQVLGPTDNMVVVYRGVERESYSCAPRCERRLVLGDSQLFFDPNAGQIGVRNSLGQTGAPPAKN